MAEIGAGLAVEYDDAAVLVAVGDEDFLPPFSPGGFIDGSRHIGLEPRLIASSCLRTRSTLRRFTPKSKRPTRDVDVT